MPASLAQLAKSFNLPIKKGFSCHTYIQPDTLYSKVKPERKHFQPALMSSEDRRSFDDWYYTIHEFDVQVN